MLHPNNALTAARGQSNLAPTDNWHRRPKGSVVGSHYNGRMDSSGDKIRSVHDDYDRPSLSILVWLTSAYRDSSSGDNHYIQRYSIIAECIVCVKEAYYSLGEEISDLLERFLSTIGGSPAVFICGLIPSCPLSLYSIFGRSRQRLRQRLQADVVFTCQRIHVSTCGGLVDTLIFAGTGHY